MVAIELGIGLFVSVYILIWRWSSEGRPEPLLALAAAPMAATLVEVATQAFHFLQKAEFEERSFAQLAGTPVISGWEGLNWLLSQSYNMPILSFWICLGAALGLLWRAVTWLLENR